MSKRVLTDAEIERFYTETDLRFMQLLCKALGYIQPYYTPGEETLYTPYEFARRVEAAVLERVGNERISDLQAKLAAALAEVERLRLRR